LELKGQMVFCPESDSILFVGSPFLDGLDGLTGRGLFISDIPLHDATRDVILVGEQARAQVSYESCFIIYGCYIIRLRVDPTCHKLSRFSGTKCLPQDACALPGCVEENPSWEGKRAKKFRRI
jgi:hypothetical protein